MSDETNEANQVEAGDTNQPGETNDAGGASELFDESFAGEPEYANGPDGPSAPVKRKKPGRGRPNLEAVKRRQVRDRVRAFRARQVDKPKGRVKQQQDALAALPEDQRAALLAQQEEVRELHWRMNDTIGGILKGRVAGEEGENGMYWPDVTFVRVRDFIAQHPLVTWWTPGQLTNLLDQQAWLDCDDQEFLAYGVRTRVVRMFWSEFIRVCVVWCQSHADECEPGVLEAVQAEDARLTGEMEARLGFEPRFIPEPVVFTPENERQAAIEAKELAEEFKQREIQNYERWQIAQLGEANNAKTTDR